MFGCICKNCGNTEIVHQLDKETLIDYYETGRWPDLEYQEDGPTMCARTPTPEGATASVVDLEEFNPETALVTKKSGFRYPLGKCPGFAYRKEDRQKVIDCVCRAPVYIEYIPAAWQKTAKQFLAKSND
jgi:hypothetical protein